MRFLTLLFCLVVVGGTNHAQYGQINNKSEVGYAVYYADYLHGRSTALGEVYNKNAYTCAHKTHPLGTILKVTRIDNGRSVLVRVNDRGPFNPGLIIDLSRVAAEKIDLITAGKTRVTIKVIGHSDKNPMNSANEERRFRKTLNAYEDYYGVEPRRPSTYNQREDDLIAKGDGKIASSRDGIQFLPKAQKGYAVQLASFGEYSNAERQYRTYLSQGMDHLYLKEERTRGKTLYKVMLAVFSSMEKAQEYLQNARTVYRVDGIVVKL